jgi:hypothetical protein
MGLKQAGVHDQFMPSSELPSFFITFGSYFSFEASGDSYALLFVNLLFLLFVIDNGPFDCY